jgi:hypothetical protein
VQGFLDLPLPDPPPHVLFPVPSHPGK